MYDKNHNKLKKKKNKETCKNAHTAFKHNGQKIDIGKMSIV